MSSAQLVTLDVDADGVAWVRINRPQVLNAIDVALARALHDAIVPLASRAEVRCVVLSGNGRAFVAGGDLARFADDFENAAVVVGELLDALDPVIQTLASMNAPVLACVHGAVAGAGLSLMLACDHVLAADDTRFLLAYDRVGATPDCGGTWFLPRRIGYRQAMNLMLMGQACDSQQALALGLVDQVIERAQLEQQAQALASRLAAGPTLAYGAYKRLLQESRYLDLAAQQQRERAAFCAATHSADFKEGVSSFLDKRAPRFVGR